MVADAEPQSGSTQPKRRRLWRGCCLGVLVAAVAGYLALFRASPLDPEAYPEVAQAVGVAIEPHPEVSFSLIQTAYTDSPQAMIFRGGSLFATHRTTHMGVLIKHPSGLVLIDGGLGSRIDEEFEAVPAWVQPMLGFEEHHPACNQLSEAGIDPDSVKILLLTHLHWDHASALRDFPQAAFWTTKAEYDYAMGDAVEPPSYLRSQYDDPALEPNWVLKELTGPAYEGYPHSLDVFGDGVLVLVPLEGHTPGALGIFLNLDQERRYFFVGDTVWSAAAIALLAEKMPLARWLADGDAARVRAQIVRLHRLQERDPRIVIVPAHDAVVHAKLPAFPAFSE